MYDILIKNCRIIDGSGAPWYRADVAVKGGKIVKAIYADSLDMRQKTPWTGRTGILLQDL